LRRRDFARHPGASRDPASWLFASISDAVILALTATGDGARVMLIKKADDKSQQLADLERRANGDGPDAKYAKADFNKLKSGIKGEQDAAYLIDFDYGDTNKNWCVIHDLRLEHAGRVAQIDHLLINRFMDFYVLESKHFNDGIRITEAGEFERWSSYKSVYEGMASPLEQNERHIKVLEGVVGDIDMPARLGFRIEPAFHSFVIISATARIQRPRTFDSSRVIKADLLTNTISERLDNTGIIATFASAAAKLVSSDTIEYIAKQLVSRHSPLVAQKTQGPPARPKNPESAPRKTAPLSEQVTASSALVTVGPTCKSCGGHAGKIEYAYTYYFVCAKCGTKTGQKGLSCKQGHAAKLRKSKENFYLDCPQCGSSDLYHTNQTA
jgi:hypothetical protein